MDEKGIVMECPHCGQRNRLPLSALDSIAKCGKCKESLEGVGAPINVDEEAAFASLIQNSALPVLVDFWADWCGPCKMVAPELEKVARNGRGKWLVAKVETDLLPGVSQEFGISSIPTMVLFEHGREVSRISGARPAAQIEAFIMQAAARR